MAISPSLQQFKSSGVYRLEFDRSQITNIPAETIRLVIGFSKKGPFNTPVFVQDSTFFTAVFGEIDTTLERKGSFFHRTVLTCLSRGPVIVLNLLSLDDDLDTSNFQSLSTSATDSNSAIASAPLSSYFNKDKFWFADPTALIDTTNNTDNQSSTARRLLNIANIGRKTNSVIIKKAEILGFDVLAKDWYGVGKVPFWMNENDYISDYMIDVIIVEGDFSNYTNLSIDPIFGPYFDSKGLKKTYVDQFGISRDGLTSFLALPQVNVLGVYTGALIPEFQDKNGNNMFIQDLVNLETSRTGILMAVNQEAYDDQPYSIAGESRYISGDLIDTVGHTIESEEPGTLNFLSYFGTVIEDLTYSFSGNTETPNIFTIGATPGQTGANALVSASASLQGGTGYTSLGSTGYFDTVTIYGPDSSVLPSNYSTAFSSQAQFDSFASDIKANPTKYFLQGTSRVLTGPTSDATYLALSDVTVNSTENTVTLKIALTLDASTVGVTGPTSTANGWFYVGGAGVTSGGGTANMRIINNAWQFNSGNTFGIYAGQDSTIYQANLSGIITDGDRISNTGSTAEGATYSFVQFNRGATYNFGSSFANAFNGTLPKFNRTVNYAQITTFATPGFTGSATSTGSTSTFAFKTLAGSINETLVVDSSLTPSNPTTIVWLNDTASGPLGAGGFSGKIAKGNYLVQNFGGTGTPSNTSPLTGKSRLTRVIAVQKDENPLSSTYGYIKVTTNDPIYVSVDATSGEKQIERYQDIRNFADRFRFSSLSGYTLRDSQMPNGTPTRQNEILDVMYNSNIAQALTDRETISFRYIVDTFEGLIEPASKVRLTRLAKNHQSSLAICNMPSVKQFRNSTNPLFKFDSTSSFDTQYVPSGGNLSLNPSNVFSLPGIADGANYGAFYGPNLVIRENGANISVPPAAHVSNLFIDKFTQALPYSIVAGPRRGVVTGQGLVGVEYNFDRNDLDFIEPFGYNAIVNKRGFGLTINANQTAQQTVKSALSQIHVRELLIYIQDGIEAILKNYRWEFNTAQNRLEIKTLADNFLSQVLNDGGVFDFQNIMDTTNNTAEVIDSNIGILDTYVEPVRGMGILVHRTTILRTGTIATGNFL